MELHRELSEIETSLGDWGALRRKKAFEDLQEKIDATRKEAALQRRRLKAPESILNDLRSGVDHIFSRADQLYQVRP